MITDSEITLALKKHKNLSSESIIRKPLAITLRSISEVVIFAYHLKWLNISLMRAYSN